MFTATYNLSAQIKAKLDKIDRFYREIVLVPLSPKIESQLKWSATLAHIEGWATLANQPLSKNNIIDIFERLHAKHTSEQVTKVLRYKDALTYIREFWSANPTPVTFSSIKELANILGVQPGSQPEIESLLTYLQTGSMHPVIQAAIVQVSFYPSRLAHLTSLLFLARYGYDLRGYLALEDFWSLDKDNYLSAVQKAVKSENVTTWLEYFCEAVIVQMTKVQSAIGNTVTLIDQGITKHITVRQKAILANLEKPGLSITNRQVQAMFNISQVTASRDLAGLAKAGFLVSHGLGRSTSYTKI